MRWEASGKGQGNSGAQARSAFSAAQRRHAKAERRLRTNICAKSQQHKTTSVGEWYKLLGRFACSVPLLQPKANESECTVARGSDFLPRLRPRRCVLPASPPSQSRAGALESSSAFRRCSECNRTRSSLFSVTGAVSPLQRASIGDRCNSSVCSSPLHGATPPCCSKSLSLCRLTLALVSCGLAGCHAAMECGCWMRRDEQPSRCFTSICSGYVCLASADRLVLALLLRSHDGSPLSACLRMRCRVCGVGYRASVGDGVDKSGVGRRR